MPSDVARLSPEELAAAIRGAMEADAEGYRLASFPLFHTHGKEGETWAAFLRRLGLAPAGQEPPAPTPKRRPVAEIYRIGEEVRRLDLGRR